MIDFDMTVRVGDLLTAAAIIAGTLAVGATMRLDLKTLKHRLDDVDDDISSLTKAMSSLARQDERMLAQGKRIDEIGERIGFLERHGWRGISDT